MTVTATPDKKIRTINLVTVSAVFLLVLLLSYMCPLITDDLHFKFIWNGFDAVPGQETRVSSLGDTIESAKNYYQFSGGRVICHFIVFTLVNLNRWVFAVLNSMVFVASGWLIYAHLGREYTGQSKWMLPLIYLSVFLLLPVWGDSVLWISGSVNYLWAGTAFLWALYQIDKQEKSVRNNVLTGIAVLIASSTNEISGGMLTVVLILRMLAWKEKPLHYYYYALFCVIPGMGLVLTAPGNANRQLVVDGHQSLGITDVIRTSYGYLAGFLDWGSILLTVIFIMLFYLIFTKRKLSWIISSMTITISCFAGAAALGFSGVVIQRALFTVILPLLIPFWRFVYVVIYKMKRREKFRAIIAAFIVISVLELIFLSFMTAAIALLVLVMIILIDKLSHGRLIDPWKKSKVRGAVIMSVLAVLVLVNSALFLLDVKRYDSYIDQTVSAMKADDSEALMSISPEKQLYSSFFPAEGTIVSDYSVSWIYEYYVISGGR